METKSIKVSAKVVTAGNSVEKFLKQKKVLSRVMTMKIKSSEKLSLSICSCKSETMKIFKQSLPEKKKNICIRFIDEIDHTKPLCDIIDIESFKIFNIDISEEVLSQKCSCLIF